MSLELKGLRLLMMLKMQKGNGQKLV
uniref:Uncharacterized protein n=1 Tax=Rhizophora mucronata TaxID=61149 RepID=A0A2P2QAF4_RHIMU